MLDAELVLKENTGAMVALFVPAQAIPILEMVQAMLPIEDRAGLVKGEDMHLTLAYLGPADEQQVLMADVEVVIRRLASLYQPLEAAVQGTGQFVANEETEGKRAFYASIDAPGILLLHQALVHAVEDIGARVQRASCFIPHVTLAYTSDPLLNVTIPRIPFIFGQISVAWANKRLHYQLGQPSPVDDMVDRMGKALQVIFNNKLDGGLVEGLKRCRWASDREELDVMAHDVLGITPRAIDLMLSGHA